MSVVFREAIEADLPVIIALLSNDYLGKSRESADLSTYRQAFQAIAADPNNAVIVGDLNGQIVASYQLTVIAHISLSAIRRAQIEGVRVDGSVRGQGIGAAMLQDAETRARAAGAKLLQLTMNSSRDEARRFYEANGFQPSHIGFKKSLSD